MNTLIVIMLLLILLLLIWHIWQTDKTNCITPEFMERCMEVSIEKQFSEHDRTYKQTIEECENLMVYVTRGFYKKYYPAEEAKGYSLYDLVAKYGLENIIDNWDEWREENESISN